MSTIDRVLQLAKEKGISQAFICGKLGLRRTYLSEVRIGKDSLPDDRLITIADILDTTPEYLKGEIDQKEKVAEEHSADELSDVYFRLAKSFQESEIDPEDIKLVLETIKRLRKNK